MSFAKVKEIPVERFSTGHLLMDRVFGSSRVYQNKKVISETWGLPRGKLLLVGGEEGVGKTKWYTLMALSLLDASRTVLVFQLEMYPGEYKQTFMNMCRSMGVTPTNLERLHVYREFSPEDQAKRIREHVPDLVIFDSFPMVQGHNSQKGIDRIVLQCIKPALLDTNSCGIMIAHLNERKAIKGNNHIRYMVDGVFYMEWAKGAEHPHEEQLLLSDPHVFKHRLKLYSAKNRGGESGTKAYLVHNGDRLEVMPEMVYASDVPAEQDNGLVQESEPLGVVSGVQAATFSEFFEQSSKGSKSSFFGY